jgi:hypothetical protein
VTVGRIEYEDSAAFESDLASSTSLTSVVGQAFEGDRFVPVEEREAVWLDGLGDWPESSGSSIRDPGSYVR